ncbi:hypothetical protein AKJ09_11439 [Labilithrix luteola]|uniref:BNR repeat domain protein n=1 Tax=Labilithrix luteola TaxID=1391654 RepID=A0A0K1QG85_9BACT|nr:hypothetical protein [Labilithrix luteola]AKV04776.1 hypothetical protein AKJ09_11439 [Labilithrix luteola]
MRFTRRLLDRRAAGLAAVLCWSATVVATASCSSSERGQARFDSEDASREPAPASDATADAGTDADVTVHDAGPIDASARPVECTTAPCAVSLDTTFIATSDTRREGFCALLADGTVACWGTNAGGELGDGDDAGGSDSVTPLRVPGLSNIVKLAHTCAIDKDGASWCWGTGPFDPAEGDAAAPITVARTPVKLAIPSATAIDMSPTVICALTGGEILCWGKNATGQVAPYETAPWIARVAAQPMALPAGAPVRDLAVGAATFALRDDGTVVSWGANPPLGRVSPLSPDPYPAPIVIRDVTDIDVARTDACAVSNGTGYCWGPQTDPGYSAGRLVRALPAPVVTPEPITRIATTPTLTTSSYGTIHPEPYRWCAVGISGAAYCWGSNDSGQAGDGKTDYAWDAVKVKGLPDPVAQIKTTLEATCALLTTGKIYCWGSNFYGQLGNGKVKQPSLVPQEVVLP